MIKWFSIWEFDRSGTEENLLPHLTKCNFNINRTISCFFFVCFFFYFTNSVLLINVFFFNFSTRTYYKKVLQLCRKLMLKSVVFFDVRVLWRKKRSMYIKKIRGFYQKIHKYTDIFPWISMKKINVLLKAIFCQYVFNMFHSFIKIN